MSREGGVPSLKKALLEAQSLGLEVRAVRRTGEIVVRDPLLRSKPLVVNARRKDSTKELDKMLRLAREARRPGTQKRAETREYLANPNGPVYWSCGQEQLRRDHPGCSRREGHDGPHTNQWGRTWPRRDTDTCAPKKSTAD